jgi:hypothetical protein
MLETTQILRLLLFLPPFRFGPFPLLSLSVQRLELLFALYIRAHFPHYLARGAILRFQKCFATLLHLR